MIGGALMVLYPPPHGFYRGPFMPVVGWAGLACGIYLSAKSLISHVETTNKQLPDATSRSTRPIAPKLGWRWLFVPAAAYVTWSGVSRGYLSLVGLGVIGLSLVVGGMVARRYGPPWPR